MFDITLAERPAGYALDAATGIEGHPLRIITREFTSSEDGEKFISRLEGLPNKIVAHLSREAGIRPSQIDHLLAIIRNDLSCSVYVNELPIVATIRATRAIESGEEITEDDIGDLQSLDIGVQIPTDAAVVAVLSAGWRKGLFFDLDPINGHGDRQYDLPQLLTSYFAYLHNQAIFALDEADWTYLIEQLWFPFVGLPRSLLKTLIGRARTRDSLDILVPKVRDEIVKRIPGYLRAWGRRLAFAPHFDLLKHATDEFIEGDYISATSILYPRIEGLLREVQLSGAKGQKITQPSLARHLVAEVGERQPHSWLMPEMFKKYLEKAYFANFEPGQPAKLSRNTVSHGVAASGDFNEKAAAIGLLVVEQIQWFLPNV